MVDLEEINNQNKNFSQEESFEENKININDTYAEESTLSQSLATTYIENSKFLEEKEKSKKKKKKKTPQPIITEEMKEQIEKMVDTQFEELYNKLNTEYEEKIEELLIEQEKIFNKNEIIKAKYNALETYLKNYCKKANIDYESLQ